ncbi:MAG: RNA polymerase factor sigma-54 [Alphaproteobacteria bacterium]
MAVTPRLDLKLKQSLVMTPQLQQAIKLLQMSNLELAEYVTSELEKNPLLETEDETLDRVESKIISEEETISENPEIEKTQNIETDAPLDIDSDYAESDLSLNNWKETNSKNYEYGENVLEQTISHTVNFREHILDQINLAFPDNADRIIAVNILDMLDPSGYLFGDVKDIEKKLGCSEGRMNKILAKLKTFEPTGVFCRNLAECLAEQLKEKNKYDPAIAAMLDNLDLVAAKDYNKLQKVCGVDLEDVLQMIKEIKELNPKPASIFEYNIVQTVVPDIIMRTRTDGSWTLELNSGTLPRVLINNDYLVEINSLVKKREEKSFINEKISSANWLIKSLQQRANTILKTATEIVIHQQDFFEYGIEFFKPLTLRDIAEAVEMHESTISRVTTNKYIATPRGVFELKYFFSQALGASSGQSTSSETIKFRIKALIDEENHKKILSDDKIVEILQKEGVDIARRTVTKYREAMKIPSSVQRRRDKKTV